MSFSRGMRWPAMKNGQKPRIVETLDEPRSVYGPATASSETMRRGRRSSSSAGSVARHTISARRNQVTPLKLSRSRGTSGVSAAFWRAANCFRASIASELLPVSLWESVSAAAAVYFFSSV